jgi:hypothetical protein
LLSMYYCHPPIYTWFCFHWQWVGDIISHRLAIGLFYIKTNPSAVNYIFCKTFNSLGVLYLLVRYCRYFVLESYRFFHGNVINIAMIFCFF